MSFKKKIIIGFIALIGIGIGISAISKFSNVIAGEATPNMKAVVRTKNINVINGMKFSIDIEIQAGEIKSEAYDNQDIYLSYANEAAFSLISASEDGKKSEVDIENGKIKLKDFEYKKIGDKITAEPKLVRLTYLANGNGVYKGELSIEKNLKLNYTDVAGNKVENIDLSFEDDRKSLDIKIDNLIYTPSNILGLDNGIPEQINSGEMLSLQYNVQAGELKLAPGVDYDGEMDRLFSKKKRVIYVIEESVLDDKSANNELAKDSIIMGMESLLDETDNIETALISYGKEAKIIKSNGLEFYSVNELINNVQALEASEQNGNLGDAIKKASNLANKDYSYETTVILISSGNPIYYTENDGEFVVELDKEKGKVKSGIERATEYANNIADQIIVETDNDIKWIGVNYGLVEGQTNATDIISKLGGSAINIKNPYSDDFINIAKELNADFKVDGSLNIDLKSDDIKLFGEANEDYDMSFYYNIKKDENGNIIEDEEGNIIFEPIKTEQVVNIPITLSGSGVIDLAHNDNITVIYKADRISMKDEEVIFNQDNILVRNVERTSPFDIKRRGFYTGRKSGNIIQEINSNDLVELSKDNTFALAFHVTANTNVSVDKYMDSNFIENKEVKIYNYQDGKMIASNSNEITPGNEYIVVVDYHIKDIGDINATTDVGIKLTDDSKSLEDTIKIKIVDKPENF